MFNKFLAANYSQNAAQHSTMQRSAAQQVAEHSLHHVCTTVTKKLCKDPCTE